MIKVTLATSFQLLLLESSSCLLSLHISSLWTPLPGPSHQTLWRV